jgi:hypothetical protein
MMKDKKELVRFTGALAKHSTAGVTLLALCGCAFSPVNRPALDKHAASITPAKSFPITAEAALRAAEVSIIDIGYTVDVVTPEVGGLRSKVLSVTIPGPCDCGTWNGNEITGAAASMLQVRAIHDGQETSVQLTHTCVVEFTGKNIYQMPTRRETYPCASTGVVERKFWDLMALATRPRS